MVNERKGGGGGGDHNGFRSLGLSEPVYKGVVRMGFRMPTPVQRKALPVVLTGVDTVVMARTGSGKTCAFCIPLIERLLLQMEGEATTLARGGCRAIILSPTRELSLQTLKVLRKLTHFTTIKSIGIHGAENMEQQFEALASKPDVIVATPGRLAHHLSEIPDFNLSSCTMCILDEADRLLEMGFTQQIRQIVRSISSSSSSSLGEASSHQCQKLLFSATMPKVLIEFTKTLGGTTLPHVVRLDNEANVSEELRIAFITCRSMDKDATLLHVLSHIEKQKRGTNEEKKEENDSDEFEANRRDAKKERKRRKKEKRVSAKNTPLTLIFCATRHHVEYVTSLLIASGKSATMIYGTLDQEARKSNLAAFRNKMKPILVVTDVAARGIDVPLIDHVIHYHFPPNPKLFVHRSGRAARAGRIGYCWGFVDPEELPYMIDLHLFLGRRPQAAATTTSSSATTDDDDNRNDDDNQSTNKQEYLTYTLQEMTPDMVHYGSVPESILTREVENVRRIMESENTGSQDSESMRSLARVCINAMKQYRKTRSEASRDAVRRAKAILEGEKTETGQRIVKIGGGNNDISSAHGSGGGGIIPSHPLLRGMELAEYHEMSKRGKIGTLNDLENRNKRDEFLRAVSNFRPKETIFEAFATGGGKDKGIVSHVDKGRTTTKSKKNDTTSFALTAMKNMRRQMRIARDKGTALVVAGSTNALERNGELDEANTPNSIKDSTSQDREEVDEDEDDGEDVTNNDTTTMPHKSNKVSTNSLRQPVMMEGKRRMSRAERRRLKKNSNSTTPSYSIAANTDKPKKAMRGSDFRDPAFFIDNDATSNNEEAQRLRQVEAAMQPSSVSGNLIKGSVGTALRLEEAMLDIVGDENEELVQKQRMMRWDKSKRKYVQTTVGSELSGESRSKKLRLESGQLVKSDKMKLGEIYERWQKKTNRSVGRNGVFDDPVDDDDDNDNVHSGGRWGGRRGGHKGSSGGGEKLRSARDIKMERERKQDMKVKNMKKGDRKRMEQRQNQKGRNEKSKAPQQKGYQGKKGTSGRWGSVRKNGK